MSCPSSVSIENLTWSPPGRKPSQPIISALDLAVHPGEFVGVVGPNGSGKSSLLRCLYRLHTPDDGSVQVDGTPVRAYTAREFARKVAVVLQDSEDAFGLTTREVVALGRIPHLGMLASIGERDHAIIERALSTVGLKAMETRAFHSLSGGEKQRTIVARAIAQEPELLILDEPTNHLDIRFQLELLSVVQELEISALAAIHDLNLAAQYCDRLYVLSGGGIVAEGTPASILTPGILASVFEVEADVDIHPRTGRPRITFHGVAKQALRSHDAKPKTLKPADSNDHDDQRHAPSRRRIGDPASRAGVRGSRYRHQL